HPDRPSRRARGRGERGRRPGAARPRVRRRGAVGGRRPQPPAGRGRRAGVRHRAPHAHPRGAVPRDHPKDAGGGSDMSQLAVRDAAPTRTDPHGPPRAMSRLTGVTGSMVGAELLKVRKRRGLVAFSAILTVGVVTVAYAVMAILHAANPGRYGPAGGISNLSGVMGV